MSVLLFELKEEHLKLLKFLRWSINDKNFIVSTEDDNEDPAPFGANNLYEGIDLILNGKPANFDPLNTEDIETYSNEQKAEWDKLYSELPTSLAIILQTQKFEIGLYKAKFHDQIWKKINNNGC